MSPVAPPPAHLSEQAKAYLRDPDPPVPMLDYTDVDTMVRQREIEHPAWEAGNDEIAGPWVARPDVVAGVPVVRFGRTEADLDTDRVLVHVHGGAYVMGTPMANAVFAIPVAQRTGLTVVSVDYRLAPEYPYPAARDDVVKVLAELTDHRSVIAMFGESAGGGLALAAAVTRRDLGGALPDRLGLIAPWVDLSCSSDTYQTLRPVDPSFPVPDIGPAMAAAYAGSSPGDPAASPLFAELHELPPMLIQVGGREILPGDSLRLAAAVRRAGGRVVLDVWDGLWHVWHQIPDLPESVQAFDELADFLVPGTDGSP